MKKLQAIVYLLILFCIVTAFVQGNKHKQDALSCANYFDAGYGLYDKFLYWQEEGLCCKYAINSTADFYENKTIVKYCK